MVVPEVEDNITPVGELVVDLETALNNNTDSIIQLLNPGYHKFQTMAERFSPHFVLLGGHRASGKTTIIDTLVDKVNRNFIKVRTHVTREERKSEILFVPRDHAYIERDKFIENYKNSCYAFAYSFKGNLYGVPNDILINLRSNENIFPVIGIVNPAAYRYLLKEELFPNAINVIVTTTSKDDVDIRERITKRHNRDRITDEDVIAQAIDSVISDKNQFNALNKAVDIILVNNNSELDSLHRSKTEIHALRIEEYMKFHKDRSYSGAQKNISDQKPDKMRIFNNYIDILLRKMFHSNYSLPPAGNSIRVNLKEIKSHIIDYIFKEGIKQKYTTRATYNNGILYRHNGLLQLLFPQVERIPSFELENLTSLNRIRLGAITSYLGNSFVIENNPDNDAMGIYYSLSDVKPESLDSTSKTPYMLYIGFRNPRIIQSFLPYSK